MVSESEYQDVSPLRERTSAGIWVTGPSSHDDATRLLGAAADAMLALITDGQGDTAMTRALAAVGEGADVDRVYLFERHYDEVACRPVVSQRAEWTRRGIEPQIDNPNLQDLDLASIAPDIDSTLLRGESFAGAVREMNPQLRALLEDEEIKSLLLVPVEVEGSGWGFLGFDDCRRERIWTDAEISTLRAVAAALGTAMVRFRAETALHEANARFEGMAANTPGAVFQCLLAPDGTISFPYISSGGNQSFGRDLTELETNPEMLGSLIHPEDAPVFWSSIESAMHLGEAWSWEGRGLDQQGEIHWISAVGTPTVRPDGSILWHGLFLDVTERREAQLRLQASEERAAGILESITDAFFALDADWRFTYVNNQAESLLASNRDDLLGRTLWDAFPEIAGTPFERQYRRAVTEHTSVQFTAFYPPLDGWYDVKAFPFEGGLSVFFGDVGQRERARQALAESETRFRRLAETAPVLIWMSGPDAGLTYVSGAWLSFTGRSMEEELGEGWIEMVHPEDRPECVAVYRGAFDRREAYEVAYRLRRHDGQYRWMIDRGTPRYGQDDVFLGFVGTCTDIHDQRVAIAERDTALSRLSQSEAHFRQIADAMPQIVWTTRPDGYHNYFNRRWYDFTGMSREPGQGFAWKDYLHPDDLDRSVARWQHSVETGVPYEVEYRFRSSEGIYRWFIGRAEPLMDAHGRVVRWFGTCTDIQDRKEYEQGLEKARHAAEEAARVKTVLLTNMSHEIRTPLTAMIGFSDVLAMEVGGEQRELVEHIRHGGARLMETLNSVLDLAHLEAEGRRLELEPIDLSAMVTDRLSLLDVRARAKGLSLTVDQPQDPVIVQGNAPALDRIITNLVANAIKFTSVGRVAVGLCVDGDQVDFRVADTGVGIDEAFIPFLFDEFRQESEGLSRDFEGNGLGLAITRRLADALGATISVESEKGRGTTFTVRFRAAN